MCVCVCLSMAMLKINYRWHDNHLLNKQGIIQIFLDIGWLTSLGLSSSKFLHHSQKSSSPLQVFISSPLLSVWFSESQIFGFGLKNFLITNKIYLDFDSDCHKLHILLYTKCWDYCLDDPWHDDMMTWCYADNWPYGIFT